MKREHVEYVGWSIVIFILLFLAAVVSRGEEPKPPNVVQAQEFLSRLNGHRAQLRLRPLIHDQGLANGAAQNCYQMSPRGRSGHYFVDPTAYQVAVWLPWGATVAIDSFWSSAPHRHILLLPHLTRCGVWFDGTSWTCNLR